MQIEITTEQFNQIQDEIIRLEEVLQLMDRHDAWGIIGLQEHIEELKDISNRKKITI